jgi:hypothetical protein
VAYFSSIAELAVSASRNSNNSNDTVSMTYFDSVAFLTMFLLIGTQAHVDLFRDEVLTLNQDDSLKLSANTKPPMLLLS